MRLKEVIKSLISPYINPKFPPSLDKECNLETHGNPNYGAWTLCPDSLSNKSIVYAVGVGEDVSFDLSLIEKYGLEVHAFDPTPKSIAWVENQSLPTNFHFYPYGLSDKDGPEDFFPPENQAHVSHTILPTVRPDQQPIKVDLYRLQTVMHNLGHRKIDILKLDIEGAEYQVINDIAHSKSMVVDQILVEFHHRFASLSKKHTLQAIRSLQKSGYKLYYISKTNEEFSFILDNRIRIR